MWAILKLIPLKTWLLAGLVISAVSFHYIDRSRAVSEALASQKSKVEVQYLKSEIEYRDRWIDKEGMLSFLAARERAETFRRNQSILARSELSKKEYRDAIPTFPAGGNLRIDAERLRRFNQIVSSPRPAETP